jgi:hypothetical protein
MRVGEILGDEMAEGNRSESRQAKATPEKQKVPSADRIRRMGAALEFLGDATDALIDSGNQDMPGFAANGFAEVLRWAGRQLRGER